MELAIRGRILITCDIIGHIDRRKVIVNMHLSGTFWAERCLIEGKGKKIEWDILTRPYIDYINSEYNPSHLADRGCFMVKS